MVGLSNVPKVDYLLGSILNHAGGTETVSIDGINHSSYRYGEVHK